MAMEVITDSMSAYTQQNATAMTQTRLQTPGSNNSKNIGKPIVTADMGDPGVNPLFCYAFVADRAHPAGVRICMYR
ncbi:MAG: hypothetical protein V4603_06595 [Pseudomonadota bacterium]